jgi:nucleotidyltransferase substrate binding protein (TIGR01987 family)
MLDLTALRKAVGSLKIALDKIQDSQLLASLDADTILLLKAGVVQNFEFTYELCLKFMKRWLSENLGTDVAEGLTRKELFRKAGENLLIGDVEKWIIFHKARNLTSHTYNAETAEEICGLTGDFYREAQSLLKVLERKND